MSQDETIYKFDTDNDFQEIIESFIPKFKVYLSTTPTADLRSFLNSYENIYGAISKKMYQKNLQRE